MKDQISALMDGELDAEEAEVVLARVRESQDLRQDWMAYHLIGDSLRSAPSVSDDFGARFAERLAQEPTVLAPALNKPQPDRAAVVWSVAASMAAVSVVAWAVLQMANGASSPDRMVAQLAPVQNGAITPASVDPYLIAHQEFSPSTVMQGVAPYIRVVHEQRDGAQ